jgi:hypothetical protein
MLPIFEFDSIAGVAQLAAMLVTSITIVLQWLLMSRTG